MENILEKIRASFSAVPSFQAPPEDALKKIRLLLYRDCERRGRKCLYDSKYVVKEGEKFLYKIPPGSTKEIRDLSEYIFGCVPLSDKVGTKRFCKIVNEDKTIVKYVWSQVFCANGRNRWRAPVETTSSSSGYCTTSDDSSADLKKQQWSLPTILSYWSNQNPVLQSSHSLPGTFSTEVRTLLGLAVVIEEDSECRRNWPQHSKLIEKSTETYKEASLRAYNEPENFVKILHNFSWSYKCELLGSILHPQTINLKSLHISNYRSLPAAKTLNKFISSYVKEPAAVNVIIQTRRVDNYLKTVLYILKLVNNKYEVGLDISNYDSGIYSNVGGVDVAEEYYSRNSPTPGGSGGDCSSSGISSSSGGGCGYGSQSTTSTTESTSMEEEDYPDHQSQHHNSSTQLMTNTSNTTSRGYHSGSGGSKIGLGGLLATDEEDEGTHDLNNEGGSVTVSESVSFHLGDNSEDEPTFSRLSLGDVDISRLQLSSSKRIEMERVLCNSVENLDKYLNIEIDFQEPPLRIPSNDKLFFLNYSNSVNQLYEMQWMHSSILDVEAQLKGSSTKAKYIIYNIDKNSLNYVNVEERDCNVFQIVDYLVREKCSNEKITEYLLLHLDTI